MLHGLYSRDLRIYCQVTVNNDRNLTGNIFEILNKFRRATIAHSWPPARGCLSPRILHVIQANYRTRQTAAEPIIKFILKKR